MKGNATPSKPEENILILQQVKQEDSKPQDEVNAEQTWDLNTQTLETCLSSVFSFAMENSGFYFPPFTSNLPLFKLPVHLF